VICDSPSHIYHSALPFSPSSSWLRECYKEGLTQEVRIVAGLPEEWDACSRTIFFKDRPSALAYKGDIIAVGFESNDVVIIDAITGSSTTIFSGHTDTVSSLAFSQDGTLLVSGSEDKTAKLWDVQTGGVIKTFSGHLSGVSSVSFSPDRALIASGSRDCTIGLWDVRTGKRLSAVMDHWIKTVTAVSFQPTNSRRLISSAVDGTVQQWDIDGNRVGRLHTEVSRVDYVAYSLDGTRFISCGGKYVTVRDSESGEEVANLHATNGIIRYGCFSPNGRFVACAVDCAVYVWDITGPEPRLIGNFVGHTEPVISITFSSSLISGSKDRSVKFWQFGASQTPTNPIATDDKPTLLASEAIESVNIFAKDGVAVTSDSSGAVKIWDITTGRCKSSFSTPAKGIRDTHLANGTLVVVWYEQGEESERGECRIWDAERGRLLRAVGKSWTEPLELRISGDGSMLFVLQQSRSIQAWSTQTGGNIGYILAGANVNSLGGFLIVRGSKVWCAGQGSTGWNFGDPRIPPLPSYSRSPDCLRFDFVDRSTQNGTRPAWIRDTITGNLVFRLPERYMGPSTKMRWDGRYLVIGCPSGEVAIMDFNYLNLQ